MKAKVISFPREYFKKKNQPPLSALMIVALIDACAKQHAQIPFGPIDVKGSFIALVKRGLIVRKEVTINKQTEPLWQVTIEAMEMLSSIGFKVPCGVIPQEGFLITK